MPKALVIAEKPSVAADLARALGKLPKKDDAFENDDFVITSAIGHQSSDYSGSLRSQADREDSSAIQLDQAPAQARRY